MKQYIQFSAGRGPVETARSVFLFAQRFAKEFPFVEIVEIEKHNTEPDCYMSVLFSGDFSDSDLAKIKENWIGTLCYRSTNNPYRPNHKRKNWFVGCNLIDPVELPEISDKDIVFESCRDGKHKGGQNQNVTESAVRATHIPTGISVVSSEERSNQQNKQRAKERLIFKLSQINAEREEAHKTDKWLKHTELERGNAKMTITGKL